MIGAEAAFDDFIGEPLLLGTILNETGTTTAIQVQVMRPRIDAEQVASTFSDPTMQRVGPNLSSIEQQRAALRGIEHFLRIEQGLALPTPERAQLASWIDSLPDGDRKEALRLELADPNKNFMENADEELVRKFFEYDRVGPRYVDRTEPSATVEAPAGFAPAPLSSFEFHLGGVPLFERNFEVVGLNDGKYVPFMFMVIMLVLFAVFRRVSGVIIPLAVVFGSIMVMVGLAFATGDLLNNLTMMSPNMLTAVGIADAIHLIAAWVLLRRKYDDKRELIREVVSRNALPVFLTSLTTAVGFYSLTVSKLEPVQMLGSMAAVGTFFAWALSMTVIPALLSLVPHKGRAGAGKPSRVERFFSNERSERLVHAVVRRRGPILAATAVVLVVAVVGLLRVEVDSDFRGMFPDDNQTMSDFQWIEDRLGGVGDLEIVFRGLDSDAAPELTAEEEEQLGALVVRDLASASGEHPTGFEALGAGERERLEQLRAKQERWSAARIGVSTRFLESLEAFESRLRAEMAQPGSELAVITDFISPLDTLRKIHQVQNRNEAALYRVPGEGDVPDELRRPVLEYDEWTEEWSMTARAGRVDARGSVLPAVRERRASGRGALDPAQRRSDPVPRAGARAAGLVGHAPRGLRAHRGDRAQRVSRAGRERDARRRAVGAGALQLHDLREDVAVRAHLGPLLARFRAVDDHRPRVHHGLDRLDLPIGALRRAELGSERVADHHAAVDLRPARRAPRRAGHPGLFRGPGGVRRRHDPLPDEVRARTPRGPRRDQGAGPRLRRSGSRDDDHDGGPDHRLLDPTPQADFTPNVHDGRPGHPDDRPGLVGRLHRD